MRLSRICRILHILRKPNSIIALLFIQKIFFAQTCKLYSRRVFSLLNDTTLCPGFLGQWFNNLWCQWFNNLQRAALLTSFWRQWFNNLQRTALLTSLVQYVWVIDQVWGQDVWTLAKFFFCVFMDRGEVEVHKLAKKEEANIQPSWPNKLGQ